VHEGTGRAGGAEGTEKRGTPVVVLSGGGTGGHLYPALVLADRLRRRSPGLRAVFVGAERGLEARVLPERGEEHLLLPLEGFRRGGPLRQHLGALRALAGGVRRLLAEFRRLRPQGVVVTGGYAGAAAGVAAVLRRIPLILQEQNSVPGLVTRALSPFARQLHLAFPEALKRLPPGGRRSARVTGNPVASPEARDRGEARRSLGLPAEGRVILAVGGSQGSAFLNRLFLEIVARVEKGEWLRAPAVHLLWSTGPRNLDEVRDALPREVPAWVRLVGYIDDMPSALAAADLAVSRAGAIATAEFLAWGLPSLLVPLPTAAADHQRRNARALARGGAALVREEEGLDPRELWRDAVALLGDPDRLEAMARAARARGRPRAADEIAGEILRVVAGSGRTPHAGGRAP